MWYLGNLMWKINFVEILQPAGVGEVAQAAVVRVLHSAQFHSNLAIYSPIRDLQFCDAAIFVQSRLLCSLVSVLCSLAAQKVPNSRQADLSLCAAAPAQTLWRWNVRGTGSRVICINTRRNTER